MMRTKVRIRTYKPNVDQKAFHALTKTTKELLVVSSIRSGKSFAMCHDSLKFAQNHHNKHEVTLVCGPTFGNLEAPIVNFTVGLAAEWGILGSYAGMPKNRLVLKNGNQIIYRSLESADKGIRGITAARAYIDETALASEESVDIVRGRLLTTDGALIMTTTPRGINNWMYGKYIENGKLAGVDYLDFSIFNNPTIKKETIDRLLARYDPLMARQEIYGEWVNLSTESVYYTFDHIQSIIETKQKEMPTYIGIDFNVGINAWVALQMDGYGGFEVIYNQFGAKTLGEAAEQIKSKFGANVIVVPDPHSGRSNSSGKTPIQELRLAGLTRVLGWKKQIPRTARYSVVNALFQNALGQRMLKVDKRCSYLISELKKLTYKTGTDTPDDQGGKIGHVSDALGYVLWYLTNGGNFVPRKINEYGIPVK